MNSKGSSHVSYVPKVYNFFTSITLTDGTKVRTPNRASKADAVKDAAKYLDLLLGEVESFYVESI